MSRKNMNPISKNIKPLMHMKDAPACVVNPATLMDVTDSLNQNAKNVVFQNSVDSNVIPHADYGKTKPTVTSHRCRHFEFIMCMRYMVAPSDIEPDKLLMLSDDRVICKLCNENIGCGHICYISSVLFDAWSKKDQEQLKEQYYSSNVNGQPVCKVCNEVLTLAITYTRPCQIIDGVIDAALKIGVDIKIRIIKCIAQLIIMQLKDDNFTQGINHSLGAEHLIVIAMGRYTRIPANQDEVDEYIINLVIIMVAVICWAHIYNDRHDILAIKSKSNVDAVVAEVYNNLMLSNRIMNIVEDINDIIGRTILKVREINEKYSDNIRETIYKIFKLIDESLSKQPSLNLSRQKQARRHDYICIPSTRSYVIHEEKETGIIGNVNAYIANDGHIHEFINDMCTVCRQLYDDDAVPINHEQYIKAVKFQEFNRHLCKNGMNHLLKDGKCERCGRSDDMPLSEIINNDELLNAFEVKITPIGHVKRTHRKPAKIVEVNTVRAHGKAGFLDGYIADMFDENFIDIENGDPFAICNCTTSLKSSIISILADAGELNSDIMEAAILFGNSIKQVNLNFTHSKNYNDLVKLFVHFLRIVSVAGTISQNSRRFILGILNDKQEYCMIKAHIEQLQSRNILDFLQLAMDAETGAPIEDVNADPDEITADDIDDVIENVAPIESGTDDVHDTAVYADDDVDDSDIDFDDDN